MTLLKFCDKFESASLKIHQTDFRRLGHAFIMNKILFVFLPEITEANNVAQYSFSMYMFVFAPNVKSVGGDPQELDYFGTRV